MKIGIAADIRQSRVLRDAGFDFLEVNVQGFLSPLEPELLSSADAAILPIPSANCLLPAAMKTTGPEVSMGALDRYLASACQRAARAGIRTMVFGSGGSRTVPDGFDRNRAYDQLLKFGAMAAKAAHDAGLIIVAEPLNKRECNILNTVAECGAYVEAINHPGMRLIVDSYHFWTDDNDMAAIARHAALIHHVHVATVPSRKAPGAEPCDFAGFFGAIKAGGYDGPIAFEGAWQDVSELKTAIMVIRKEWKMPSDPAAASR
jgi:sugar phosphate isomerase/epimerase